MALIKRHGLVRDDWVRLDDREALPPGDRSRVIVSLARLPAAIDVFPPQRLGVFFPNDVAARQLLPHFDRLGLIAVEFPGSADGRGFSLARQLRRLGFGGQLRASGPLIADQFAFALSCGFDSVEIPAELAARQPEWQWLAALDSIEHSYQTHYAASSILQRRAAARRAVSLAAA